ncbi:hypothetical protein L195_g059968 [Trifolium pratense]|uniref:Uncharacterized protein n=1 Tax=Trifolium pratense TaxID=57577 RepID=A0A2K3K153_TRIPR|nr:hypothetical protein L195_g059968 [Trifolium pratense]
MNVWGKSPYLSRFPSKHNPSLNSQLQCTQDISRSRVRFDGPTVENEELCVEKTSRIGGKDDAKGKFVMIT